MIIGKNCVDFIMNSIYVEVLLSDFVVSTRFINLITCQIF